MLITIPIIKYARDKIWTYNLGRFKTPLNQLSFSSLRWYILASEKIKIFLAINYYNFLYLKPSKTNKNLLNSMEISGLEPETIICKIIVLPIKLCPLNIYPYYCPTYKSLLLLYIYLESVYICINKTKIIINKICGIRTRVTKIKSLGFYH